MNRIYLFLTVFCVLLAFPDDAQSEIPDTYLGRWELDLERTFSIHLGKMSEKHPGIFGAADIEEVISGLKTAAGVPGVKMVLTITEGEITSSQASSGLEKTYPYRVISGNSNHVVIESTPSNEEPMISTIRLVEGGIAVSQEDCSDDPERCVRRQRNALEEVKEKLREKAQEKLSFKAPDAGEGARDAPTGSLVIQADREAYGYSDQPRSTPSISNQPEWFYFITH